MNIKKTSKSLKRVNNDQVVSIQYHDTVVLSFNRETRVVTFRTDGWSTMNTARAMSFGLKDLGVIGHVEYRNNKKESGLFLVMGETRQRIEHGSQICMLSKLAVALK